MTKKQTPKKEKFINVRISERAYLVFKDKAEKDRRSLVNTIDIIAGV